MVCGSVGSLLSITVMLTTLYNPRYLLSLSTNTNCSPPPHTYQVLTPCGATLIVCPSSILGQWVAEIQRHSAPGAVRLAVYRGQDQGLGGGRTTTGKVGRSVGPDEVSPCHGEDACRHNNFLFIEADPLDSIIATNAVHGSRQLNIST